MEEAEAEAEAEGGENQEKKDTECKIFLIRALQKYVSAFEKRTVEDWIVKLQSIEDGTEEAKVRDEYLTYLLIKMQKGILSQPFHKSPTPGQLQPLSNVLSSSQYEDVQKQIKINYCATERLLNNYGGIYEKPKVRCEPSRFHSEQPRPRTGVTASFAVFSNYEDN